MKPIAPTLGVERGANLLACLLQVVVQSLADRMTEGHVANTSYTRVRTRIMMQPAMQTLSEEGVLTMLRAINELIDEDDMPWNNLLLQHAEKQEHQGKS